VLIGLPPLTLALLMVAGVALDLLLGEARRWHPLVGFGHLAGWLECKLNRGGSRIVRGLIAWLLAVVPLSVLAWLACRLGEPGGLAVHALLLYFCLGLRSLRDHALPIGTALATGDLAEARRLTARIVSRDTTQALEPDLARAGAESVLENGNDAVFGALFWFLLGGGAGALLFRLANTLDAMWGYRTQRFKLFGRVAARIDDVLNYVPARLTALSYVVLAPNGGQRRAWHCWRTQAPYWSSPNAGPVMSSGAGALGVSLGGPALYDGELESRPALGSGPQPMAVDIERAWRLVLRTALLWLVVWLVAAVALASLAHGWSGGRHA
jgi:adenosylcobinamide-phosphate synthase